MTGAQSLVRSLEAVGADVVFGIPGGAILPAYDPLFDSTKVRHILVRHEQGAGHAAEGYAQATGRVGVCMATSGPGRHQPGHADRGRLHGLGADRGHHRPGRPAVHRHRRVPGGRHLRHHAADHQAQLPGAATPRTSRGRSPRRSTSPRPAVPGRCSSTCPRTCCRSRRTFTWPPKLDLPGYRPVTRPHGKQIREAAELIAAARRPVLYVGGGVLKARATQELRQLAELDRHPGRHDADGARRVPRQPPPAPRHAGHARLGRGGARRCRRPTCSIALGARFDDRVTGKLSTFAPDATVIHADIDPAEIGKNRDADVPIVGDVREVLLELIPALEAEFAAGHRTDLTGWWRQLDSWRDDLPAGLRRADRRHARAAVRHRAARQDRRPGHDLRRRRRPAPDVGGAVHQATRTRTPG